MKKLILLLFTASTLSAVQGQRANSLHITGSWINVSVADLYESSKEKNLDVKAFSDERFTPLFLSFQNDDKVKVTFRVEQTVGNYSASAVSNDSFVIRNAKNEYGIFQQGNMLRLTRNHRPVLFKRVSDKYSSDVFGEYIKGLIFYGNDKRFISFCKGTKMYDNAPITSDNFTQKIKKIFKCDHAGFSTLGSTKYNSTRLPLLLLYYNNGKNSSRPLAYGVLIDKEEVRFLDDHGANVLVLTKLGNK